MPPDVEQVILRSKAQTSLERLAVYGNAYFARLLECLRERFPVLTQAVGQETFDQFAFGYLQSYPSTSYTLGQLGERFADYLHETRPDKADAEAGQVGWPDLLIDLARLEWSIGEVFDGQGMEREPGLDPAALRSLAPEIWPAARLVPAPCLRLMTLRFNVNDYFTALRADTQPEPPGPETTFLALTRINYVVRRIALSQEQFVLLSALAAGATVGESIERLVAEGRSNIELLMRQLPGWFQDWAEAKMFQRVDLPQ